MKLSSREQEERTIKLIGATREKNLANKANFFPIMPNATCEDMYNVKRIIIKNAIIPENIEKISTLGDDVAVSEIVGIYFVYRPSA